MRDVNSIVTHMKEAHEAFLGACGSIPASQWTRPPAHGGWSAGEVVAHLIMVETRVLQAMKEALRKPPEPVPVWKRFHLPVSITVMRGVKVKSPIPLNPALLRTQKQMLDDFSELRNRAVALLMASNQKDLGAYRAPHPFLGSLNFYDWFKMLACHEMRHTKQIEEITAWFQK